MLAREECLFASQQFLLDQLFTYSVWFRLTCFTCFTCCKGNLLGCGFLFVWCVFCLFVVFGCFCLVFFVFVASLCFLHALALSLTGA